MNLKDSFRYQNKLQRLMDEATEILGNDKNITKTQNTHLRSKVMPDAENETTVEIPDTELADSINEIMDLLMFLLSEREKLSLAIREAKQSLDIDFDGEASLNSQRQEFARLFRRMTEIRSSENIYPGAGTGYRFNTDGNQISYRCDLKKVTTINFDRNKAKSLASALIQKADTISSELDQALVNTIVEYDPPVDVNASFGDVLEWFSSEHNKS